MRLTVESVRRIIREEIRRQELAWEVIQDAGLTPQELRALFSTVLRGGGPVEESASPLTSAVNKVLDYLADNPSLAAALGLGSAALVGHMRGDVPPGVQELVAAAAAGFGGGYLNKLVNPPAPAPTPKEPTPWKGSVFGPGGGR